MLDIGESESLKTQRRANCFEKITLNISKIKHHWLYICKASSKIILIFLLKTKQKNYYQYEPFK